MGVRSVRSTLTDTRILEGARKLRGGNMVALQNGCGRTVRLVASALVIERVVTLHTRRAVHTPARRELREASAETRVTAGQSEGKACAAPPGRPGDGRCPVDCLRLPPGGKSYAHACVWTFAISCLKRVLRTVEQVS